MPAFLTFYAGMTKRKGQSPPTRRIVSGVMPVKSPVLFNALK